MTSFFYDLGTNFGTEFFDFVPNFMPKQMSAIPTNVEKSLLLILARKTKKTLAFGKNLDFKPFARVSILSC